MPDDPNPQALRDRVRELEQTVATQQETIDSLSQQSGAVSRRGLLGALAGAAGLGAAGVYGSTSAQAQASGPAGQQGTASAPNDMFAWGLDVQNGAQFNGTDLVGVGAAEVEESVTVTAGEASNTLHYGSNQDRGNAGNDGVAVGIGARVPTESSVSVGYQAARDNTGESVTEAGYEAALNNTGFGVTAAG